MPWSAVSASSPVNTPIRYGTAMCHLHEWNSGWEWKDDGWQHYELDLKAWVFLLIQIEFATAGITGIQKERIIP